MAAPPLAPEVWCNVLLEDDGEVGAAVLFLGNSGSLFLTYGTKMGLLEVLGL